MLKWKFTKGVSHQFPLYYSCSQTLWDELKHAESPPSRRHTMLTTDFINFSPDSEPGSPSLILTTGTSITRTACKQQQKKIRYEAFKINLATRPAAYGFSPISAWARRRELLTNVNPSLGRKVLRIQSGEWSIRSAAAFCLWLSREDVSLLQSGSRNRAFQRAWPSDSYLMLSQGQKEEDFWSEARTWLQFKKHTYLHLLPPPQLHKHMDATEEERLNLTLGLSLWAKVKRWKQTADGKFKPCHPNSLMVPLPKSKTYWRTPKQRSKAISCFETTRCVRQQRSSLYWALVC